MNTVDAEALLSQWWPFAQSIASKWIRRYPRLRAEIHSEVAFTAWRAALSWKGAEAHGCQFSTFLGHEVKWKLYALLKHEERQPRTMDHRARDDDDGQTDPITGRAAAVQVDLLEIRDQLRVCREANNAQDWRLLERAAAEDTGYEEMAIELRVSKARIGQRVHRAIMRARAAMGEKQG